MSYGLIHRHTVIGSGGGGSDQLAEFADGTISVWNDPTITRIVSNQFILQQTDVTVYGSNLTAIGLPNCSEIDGALMSYYASFPPNLSLISLPALKSYMNSSVTNMSTIRIGNYSYYLYNTLAAPSPNITTMYFENLSMIYTSFISRSCWSPFTGMKNLQSLYFMMDHVVDFGNIYAMFRGTPITTASGTLYVPMSLVDAYKADAVWTGMSAYIVGV